MNTLPRRLFRGVARRLVGERALPLGVIARDRRLLRRAMGPRFVGRVLVVGPSVAARQALPGERVDVAGTSPHAADVTVCSSVSDADSLPQARWDTVIITACDADLRARLRAVRPACRPRALLLVLDSGDPVACATVSKELADVASIEDVLVRRNRRLWLARTLS